MYTSVMMAVCVRVHGGVNPALINGVVLRIVAAMQMDAHVCVFLTVLPSIWVSVCSARLPAHSV